MKKINSINVCFIIVAIVFVSSCSKKDVAQPTPTPTPTPTPPSAPTLNITATSATAWYNGSDTINFTSDGAVSINGNAITAGTPIILTNLIKDTTLSFSAIKKDPVTGLSSTPTFKTLTVHILSAAYTKLIYNIPPVLQSSGWLLTTYTVENYPLTGHPTILNPGYEKIIFYIGDSCHVFDDKINPNYYGGPTPYQLTDNDNTYIFSIWNIYHIIQLDNIFKIEHNVKSANNPNDSSHYVRIYTRQ